MAHDDVRSCQCGVVLQLNVKLFKLVFMAWHVRTRSIIPSPTTASGSFIRGADVCCFRPCSVPCACTATVAFDRLAEHRIPSVSPLSERAEVAHEVHPKALIWRQWGQKGIMQLVLRFRVICTPWYDLFSCSHLSRFCTNM